MSYGYTRPDPKEAFRSWLTYHRDLINIAVEEVQIDRRHSGLPGIYQRPGH